MSCGLGKRSSLSRPGSTVASLIVVVSQHGLVVAQPFQRCFHGEFAAHLQNLTQPESLEADGDKASRHGRRAAQARTLCFRHSDEPGVHWLASSVRATANGKAPAKVSSFSLRRVSNCLLESLLKGPFQGSDSQLLGKFARWFQRSDDWRLARVPSSLRLHVCVNCMSLHRKHMFLLLSDGQARVFPHTSTCVRRLRRVLRIFVSICARHSAKTRSKSVDGKLLVTITGHQREHEKSSCT